MFEVLAPAGPVAAQEGALIVQALFLMLIVVIPVLGLMFFFAWRYRAGNRKAVYSPEWENGRLDELVWWAVPFEIVLVLAALTWFSSHALDPHRPLAGNTPPIEIQAIALPDSWVFIYPEHHFAVKNFVEIPVDTPIKFSITADAPMNSFFVPQLGGQMYAMPGMVTPLNLEADTPGDYRGFSANYSGPQFAHMRFTVRAVAKEVYFEWLASAPTTYQPTADGDFDAIVAKYR